MKFNPDCKKCHGSGTYIYTTHGTPHGKFCEDCCEHKGEPWKDENGNYWCTEGCGKQMNV